MKKPMLFCIGVMILVCATASAQPVIRVDNGVANASSYLADIARGSWFVVFGTGMGSANIAVYSGSLPYPTQLSGTSVTFTPASGGTAVNAMLWYTLNGQLAGLLPSSTAAGAYDVRVTYNGQTSAPKRVNVVDRNFGYATQSQNGAGPAQATYGGLDLNRFTTGQIGQYSTRPAKAGDSMILWGTGLGADTSSDLSGGTSGDQTSAGQVRVIVGGIEVTPAYAGRSSGSPGLDQINFTVPANVTSSCFVGLQVRAGGRLSNLGSIAVAAPGSSSCTHPTLSGAQLTRLDQGGTLVIGDLTLSKTSTKLSAGGFSLETSSESVYGAFNKYAIDTVGSANFSILQTGACSIFQRSGTTDQITQGTPPAALDAGAQLTLNGPNATNKAVPQSKSDKTYSATLYSSGTLGIGGSGSPTLTQGTYTIAGTGGADIGAFTARVDLPGNFTWANRDTLPDPIPRGSGLRIDWTGGTTGLVTIAGIALNQTGGTPTNQIYNATIFNCVAQATDGTFTVPSGILQQLPVVSNDPTSGSFGTLAVFATPDPSKGQGAFSAPLTAGGTTDQAFMYYTLGSTKSTGWN